MILVGQSKRKYIRKMGTVGAAKYEFVSEFIGRRGRGSLVRSSLFCTGTQQGAFIMRDLVLQPP